MERYKWEEIPNNLKFEEERALVEEQEKKCFLYTGSKLNEINKILKKQVKKCKNPKQKTAKDEIIDFLYNIPAKKAEKDEHEMVENSIKAEMLIDLANIVEAINNGSVEEVNNAYSVLPYGDSNTGDFHSWHVLRFSYWLMSDADREKYNNVFYNYLSNHNVVTCGNNKGVYEYLKEFERLEGLDSLIEYNNLEKEELESEC